jgi:ketosteroid isomerase-like protein
MFGATVNGFLALALLAGSSSAQTPTPSGEHLAVATAVRAFHDALARGDSLAALRLLAPDALIMEAGGLESRADYRSHHLAGDIAFAQAVPSRSAEPSVVVSGDVAWVVSTSRTTGTFRDRAINSAGAELVILTRTPEGWHIRAIHWSSRAMRTP